jgi:hypothetical protein
MHSNGSENERICFGHSNGSAQIRRSVARPDREHPLQTRLARALNDGIAISIELRVVEMTM